MASAQGDNGTQVGSKIVIRGTLAADENIGVAGRIEGKLTTTRDLTIHQGGVVVAELSACNLVVHGQLDGSVTVSDCITIHPGARVTGRLEAPRVILQDGAWCQGEIDTTGTKAEVIDAILDHLTRDKAQIELTGQPNWGGSSAGLKKHIGG
jgi:cytoskeletal protein CcmA (bactofilin family)